MLNIPRVLIMTLAIASAAGGALAQFGTPGATNVREVIAGELRNGAGEAQVTPESGDQIGAFADGEVIGLFTFTGASRNFRITLFGDNRETEQVEGPTRGDPVEFRFFDSSTNQTLTLTVLNDNGEVFNFTYQGQEIPSDFGDLGDALIDLLTPTRTFDLSVGAPATGGGGSGGGGGGSAPGGGTDINGDGGTDVRDAAIILRALSGAVRPGSRAFRDLGVMVTDPVRSDQAPEGMIQLSADALLGRCDVNNDGLVTSADAVVILRAGRGPSG